MRQRSETESRKAQKVVLIIDIDQKAQTGGDF